MKKKYLFHMMALAFGASLISGCSFPQTAQQFRKDAAHSSFLDTAHYVVDRPYADIARTFREETGRCLAIRINVTERDEPWGPPSDYYHYTYYPKLSISRTKLDLSVQMRQDGPGIHHFDIPKHGYFYLVLDATRLGPRKTKIDMYYSDHGDGHLIRAVRGWVTGRVVGCPDLTP